MSVNGFSGLPGAGKSYSVVENYVIPALKEGRVVAHNLQLNSAALALVCGREVDSLLVQIPRDSEPAELVKLCPAGCVVVIDEIWRYWGAGLKANEVPRDQLAFFKEHRHRVGTDGKATEICVIDQEFGSGVARFVRDLIELTYIHVKHAHVGMKGRFRVDVYTRCQNACKPVKSARIRQLQGRYRPEVWNCYVSHTQSDSKLGEAGLEVVPDSRGNVLKSVTVRAAIVAGFLLPFLFWFAFSAFASLGRNPEQREQRRDEGAPALALLEQPPVRPAEPLKPVAAELPGVSRPKLPARSKGPQVSRTWRLLGYVQRSDRTGIALMTSTTGRRRTETLKCEVDRSGEVVCNLDGELVTMYSGAGANPLSAGLPEGTAEDHGQVQAGSAAAQGSP